jgi:Ca2+:H+ antiporter
VWVVVWVVVVVVLFGLVLFGLGVGEDVLGGQEPEGHAGPAWTPAVAIGMLGLSAALLAVLSEQLVGAIDPFIEQFGLTPFFVGVILIPTIGNLSEHLVAVQLALKDRVDFTMAVSIGSSLQVALFVAPVLVLLGLVVGQRMDLVFAPLEVAAVAAAAGIVALVSLDGESNWLEGALLLGVYVILGVSFFYLA